MRNLRPACVVVFVLVILLASNCLAQNLRVAHEGSRLEFRERSALLTLRLENGPATLNERIKCELLDSSDRSRFVATSIRTIDPGSSTIEIELKEVALQSGEPDQVFWRLNYELIPVGGGLPLKGIIPVSELERDFFTLDVSAPAGAKSGQSINLLCFTRRVLGRTPVAGATITVKCDDCKQNARKTVLSQTTTDENGVAEVSLTIPPENEDSDESISLIVSASLRGLRQEAKMEIRRQSAFESFLMTDKHLYQPGQVIHSRILVFDANRKALADQSIKGIVTDERNQQVCSAGVQTSRQGIAAFDCPLPADARPGTYEIKFESAGDIEKYARTEVQVSRYELPTFTVNVSPDRAYYLPGQKARVEVSATYLFGKPVTSGSVLIRRERDTGWSKKKSESIELREASYTGTIDANGKAGLDIDLGDADPLIEDEEDNAYRDLHFVASFTDLSTGRSEIRKFDLRLSRNAIHIHVISKEALVVGKFTDVYLNAEYADGRPAKCSFDVLLVKESGKDGEFLGKIQSNDLGLAKLEGLHLAESIENTGPDEAWPKLRLVAIDASGLSGHYEATLHSEEGPQVRVVTDRTLYKPGQPIKVRLTSTAPDGIARVWLSCRGPILNAAAVRLRGGEGEIEFPYARTFEGELLITANVQVAEEDGSSAVIRGERAVIFPSDKRLRLRIGLEKDKYQPGDELTASLHLASARGPVAGVFGAAVVDRAVVERERTEGARSSLYSTFGMTVAHQHQEVAGVDLDSLLNLDSRVSFPKGYDLAAELLLFAERDENWTDKEGNTFNTNLSSVFANWFSRKLEPMRSAVNYEYNQSGKYPGNQEELQNLLRFHDLDVEDFQDPWGRPFRFEFRVNTGGYELKALSAGLDGKFGTGDDFVALSMTGAFFRPLMDLFTRAVSIYENKKGRSPIADAEVADALRMTGIDFTDVKDDWGNSYRFAITQSGRTFQLAVQSAGPDGLFGGDASGKCDDIIVARVKLNPFGQWRGLADRAIRSFEDLFGDPPANANEFQMALASRGIPVGSISDPMGNGLYVSVKQTETRLVNTSETIVTDAKGKTSKRRDMIPILRVSRSFTIWGNGPDGIAGTGDDYQVLSIDRVINESLIPVGEDLSTPLAGRSIQTSTTGLFLAPPLGGNITGTVADINGDVIAGTKVTALLTDEKWLYTTETDATGTYRIKGARPGKYEITFEGKGFTKTVVTSVMVKASETTVADAVLQVASASEMVVISAGAVLSLSTQSSMSLTKVVQISRGSLRNQELSNVSSAPLAGPISTPRLRQYFPETAFWAAELLSDKRGAASIKFKVPDNITSWHMVVVGSTDDGQVTWAERDFVAYQPFFADIDNPKILTVGDEITQPVIVRNYLPAKQSVKVEFEKEPWFSALGLLKQNLEVPSDSFATAKFPIRASSALDTAVVKADARGTAAADAVERPLSIHPDGELQNVTSFGAYREQLELELGLPASAIPKSQHASLTIYPNLGAHILEGVTEIMRRPYGCGEQTISSAYPSVIALGMLRSIKAGDALNEVAEKARKFARDGYERLMRYQGDSGGFSYWGSGGADLALSAYALEFLRDSERELEIPAEQLAKVRDYLVNSQMPDGGWESTARYLTSERRADVRTASVIIRALASLQERDPKRLLPATKGLAYLRKWLEVEPDAYTFANYLIAAHALGDKDAQVWASDKLKSMATISSNGMFWETVTATPFYGWGRAGNVETTALVLRALSLEGRETRGQDIDAVINRGLTWLISTKDEMGIWHSGHATVSVYRALQGLLATAPTSSATSAEVRLNGEVVGQVALPSSELVTNPITVDLTPKLREGSNRVEMRQNGESGYLTVQSRMSYYRSWETVVPGATLDNERFLDLRVAYDRTEGRIGDVVRCKVTAARVGKMGWGMMMAEIGIPPGAEADRSELESLVHSGSAGVDYYEVRPDRIVFYLWPRQRASEFTFTFRLRLAMKAKTAPSTLYDYYNPDAFAVVKPTSFVVR